MDAGEIRSKSEIIISKYCSRFPREIGRIVAILENTQTNAASAITHIRNLHAEVHRMSGSALCMGFPFLGQELNQIEHFLKDAIQTDARITPDFVKAVARKVQSIARLTDYTTPNNSVLLRRPEVNEAKLTSSRSQRNEHFRKVMSEQRILFADDDVSIRSLMREILKNVGMDAIKVASNGDELITNLFQFKPTVVITDWFMEPINGLEFLQQLRAGKLAAPKDLPVIFLSSKQTVMNVEKAVEEGVNYFLAKPFSINLVEKAIYQVVIRHNPAYLPPQRPNRDSAFYLA